MAPIEFILSSHANSPSSECIYLKNDYKALILPNKLPLHSVNNANVLFLDTELDSIIYDFNVSIPTTILGMVNLGNTCYLNSTLQCLLASGPLVTLVKSIHFDSRKCPIYNSNICNQNELFCALCGLANLVRDHILKPYSHDHSCYISQCSPSLTPHYFTKNLSAVCSSLRPIMQEDAHEYLLGLLSRLEDATLRTYHSSKLNGWPIHKLSQEMLMTNAIRRIFGGRSKYDTKCLSCQHIFSQDEHWFNLSLDIINSRTLHQCLVNYVRPELLSGANAIRCTRCKQFRSAERHCRIKEHPHLLIIQLNRFCRSQKLDFRVKFPTSFNLRQFMEASTGRPLVYRLYATLNHQGLSYRSGHYVAFTRRHSQWYLHNDSTVNVINEESVLHSFPYVLFYRHVRSPSCLKSGTTETIMPIKKNRAFNKKFVPKSVHKPSISTSMDKEILFTESNSRNEKRFTSVYLSDNRVHSQSENGSNNSFESSKKTKNSQKKIHTKSRNLSYKNDPRVSQRRFVLNNTA